MAVQQLDGTRHDRYGFGQLQRCRWAQVVSDQTRNDIWQELLDSDRLVRYYEAVANHYRRRHAFTLLLLGFGAASSFAAVFDILPGTVQSIAEPVANAFVGLVAVWVFIADYARKSAIAHTIGTQCNRLDIRWRELWADVERLEEDAARARLVALANEMAEVTQRSGDAGIAGNRRLNKRSEAAAFKTVSERYAG